MGNDRGQAIFLSIIGIATLLVAVVGATFAWFSTNVSGEASSVRVQSAQLGTVTFEDGATINPSNIFPGWSADRTVTISTTDDTTTNINYTIYLTTSRVTFVNDQFVFKATSLPTDGKSDYVVNTPIKEAEKIVVGTGTLTPTKLSDTWTFTFAFPEIDENQNINQNKEYSGLLSVETEHLSVPQ